MPCGEGPCGEREEQAVVDDVAKLARAAERRGQARDPDAVDDAGPRLPLAAQPEHLDVVAGAHERLRDPLDLRLVDVALADDANASRARGGAVRLGAGSGHAPSVAQVPSGRNRPNGQIAPGERFLSFAGW